MSKSKKLLAAAALLLLLAAAGTFWCARHYHLVDFRFYPRDARVLDLRDTQIPLSHYRKLRAKLPDCRILWNVPFQGGSYPSDTQELTVSTLSKEDVQALAFFPELVAVNAEDCRDYENLMYLSKQYPQLKLHYFVELDGISYTPDATVVHLTAVTEEEIGLLAFLPQLQTVIAGGSLCEGFFDLQTYCQEEELDFRVDIGTRILPDSTESLTETGITDDALELLRLLPELKQLHLPEPQAKAENLLRFVRDRESVAVTWEKTLLGQVYPGDTTVIDLTELLSAVDPGSRSPWQDQTTTAFDKAKAMPFQGDPDENFSFLRINEAFPFPDRSGMTAELLAELEEAMPYFPQAESVLLLGCFLDNEAMAAFREAHRKDYKVVWHVQCGKLAARTDTTYFMPIKYHVYYFFNEGCYNLKYCEDMVCIDIGHMAVSDISFVAHMPNLKYLILAHTNVRDITPLSSCKSLLFLEVDWTGVQDFTPLLGCTALEDLNVGNTFGDLSPVYQMTWLNNLWMVGRKNAYPGAVEALTDTHIVAAASATVGGGWRKLPNYFAMRDVLHMFYMEWG